MPDERSLLDRAADGDAEAWREVLELHGPFALGLARDSLRRSGARGVQGEDLVQEIWIALLANGGRNLRGIDPAVGLRGYLAASVIHAVRHNLKSSSARRRREETHPPASPTEAPDEPLLRTEREEAVEAALADLDPEDSLLLRWIYWDRKPYARISRLAGIPENNIGPTLGRARERLRRALERKKDVREGPITDSQGQR